MAGDDPHRERAEGEVAPHVRRTVGLKVLGEVSRWAEGVEREQRERPRLVLRLVVLLAVVAAAAATVTWLYYRSP